MRFRLIISEEALSQLRKLDNKTAARILDKLDEAMEEPTRFFKRLSGREECKMRAGDYRVLAKILSGEVFILSLGHRKNVYKRT